MADFEQCVSKPYKFQREKHAVRVSTAILSEQVCDLREVLRHALDGRREKIDDLLKTVSGPMSAWRHLSTRVALVIRFYL